MKIRVIQLINNFFKDENSTYVDREKALGTYCTFGYFDALQVEEGRTFDGTEKNLIWDKIEEVVVGTLDGTSSRRNLICIAEEEKKDEKFWKRAKKYPYLFISLIRIRHDTEAMKAMLRIVDEVKADNTAIAYYSYNHSELVIAKLEKYYKRGMNFVLAMRQKLNALNMYSIFSVREEVLKAKDDLPNNIASEKISVRLRIMIKKDLEIEAFLQELWEILFKDEIKKGKIHKKENFKKFYTLGSSDMMIEIKRVQMQKLLSCYSMGSLLTHTNEQFEKAVYNIETEILIRGAYIGHGKAMDNGENSKAETTA